jgi:hypothetical protein
MKTTISAVIAAISHRRLNGAKVLDRAAQAVDNAGSRLPPQELTGERDIRAAACRVVFAGGLNVNR